MGPKKDIKPVEQVQPQHVEQEQNLQEQAQQKIQEIEQEGYGIFEYPNGMVYQGQWKILNGDKVKHGEGSLKFTSGTGNEGGNEEYHGRWVNDKMEGYGVYKYTSGAIFTGDWKEGRHHGFGIYEFPDGTIYEGQFKDHKMHGEGYYIDKNGNRWEGEFVEGIYQSSKQMELKLEKQNKKKEDEIKQTSLAFFSNFEDVFSKSEKKTFKENLLPFFSTTEEIKSYFKEPYPKFEDRQPEKWNECLKWLKDGCNINVLRNNNQAQIVDKNNILVPQFQKSGQIVEFSREEGPRKTQLALCCNTENNWSIIFFFDNSEPEDKKGKK